MSLDFSKLECVKALADRTIAACPACREQGHDKKGDHLVIWPDGKFGCVSNPEDGAHRSRIFALAGEKDEKPSPARTPARRRSSWPTIEAAAASTAGWSLKSRRSHAHPTTRPSEAICRVIPTDPYLRSFWARNPPPARSWAEWLGF